jgi:cytoskeletal protein RodZ
MSAPKTNLEKEEKRHRPALLGIKASLIYAAILLAALLIWLAARGDEPGEESARLEMRVAPAPVAGTLI